MRIEGVAAFAAAVDFRRAGSRNKIGGGRGVRLGGVPSHLARKVILEKRKPVGGGND